MIDRRAAPRFHDWAERLAAFVEARRTCPHVWGLSDCCLTSADAAMAQTGIDFAAPLRGYSSERGAVKALLANGHRSVVSYLDSIRPRAVRPLKGDFVVVPDAPLDLVMIYEGREIAWRQAPHGLVAERVPSHSMFWSV